MAIPPGFPGCTMYRMLLTALFPNIDLTDWQILFCGLFFFPESPRHLIATDREDEGLRVLKKLHYDGHNGMLFLSGLLFIRLC